MRIALLIGLVAFTAFAPSFVHAEKMTLEEFRGLCISDVDDDCRSVCREMESAITGKFENAAACRKQCERVATGLRGPDAMDGCEGSVDKGGNRCAQFCDGNFPN